MANTISNSDDLIDSRDVIARIAKLEAERDEFAENPPDKWEECGQCSGDHPPGFTGDCRDDANRWPADKCVARLWAEANPSDAEELAALLALAEEASSAADWKYGETLIRDSYFVEYAQELAEDIGAIKSDASWPNNYIDWDRAANALKADYFSVEFAGITYWIR